LTVFHQGLTSFKNTILHKYIRVEVFGFTIHKA